jgi:hypothetical protein
MRPGFNATLHSHVPGEHAMLNYLWDAGGRVIRLTGEFNRTQWIFILVGVVIAGFLCLRGFGSRKDY